MKKFARNGIVALSLFLVPSLSQASSGTEGASFLDIPVGAGPAALGSAYSALAADAYAPVYNPAGLGFLPSTQLAAQHLSYLDTLQYEFASFVHPLHTGRAIGTSIQYLTSGNIPSTDNQGDNIGSFSSHYAAYNVSFGQKMRDNLSLGMTGKLINASIDGVSANAYAADLGAMYRPRENLTLAAVLTNVGTKLTFLNEGDFLPMAFHLSGAYQPTRRWNLVAEGIYEKTGVANARTGVEWWPMNMIALRAGYRTDTTKMLSAMAGLSTGIGLQVWGQEFAYAWLPYGELGSTQYLSMVLRFGEAERQRWNLVYLPHGGNRDDRQARCWVGAGNSHKELTYWDQPEEKQLMELLGDTNPEIMTASLERKIDAETAASSAYPPAGRSHPVSPEDIRLNSARDLDLDRSHTDPRP